MTFILNLLHKDFSLIASDRKARSEGPTTLRMQNITVNLANGATIYGIKKLYLSKNNSLALGIAGQTNDHAYLDKLQEGVDTHEIRSMVRKHMEGFLENDHEAMLEIHSFTNNSAIATYHEPLSKLFFSNLFSFSPIHNSTRLWSGSENARLIYTGSGSEAFVSEMSSDEIEQFLGSVQCFDDIPSCIEWARKAYKIVSAFDEGTGEEMIAYLATSEKRNFTSITGCYD